MLAYPEMNNSDDDAYSRVKFNSLTVSNHYTARRNVKGKTSAVVTARKVTEVKRSKEANVSLQFVSHCEFTQGMEQ